MSDRKGFSKLELVMTAMLLTTLMGIVSTMVPRLDRLWSRSREYQLASQELMNQMEELTGLNRDDCELAISRLSLPESLDKVIPGGSLSGKFTPESDGDRIVLRFHFPKSIRYEPIVLVGWRQGVEP